MSQSALNLYWALILALILVGGWCLLDAVASVGNFHSWVLQQWGGV